MSDLINLTFDERKFQGEWFHLTTVDSRLNQLVDYHTHDFPEIFWMDAGDCGHRLNDQHASLQHGDLVLMRPNDCHRMFEEQRSFRFTNISLAPALYSDLRTRYADIFQQLYGNDDPFRINLKQAELETLQADARRLASQVHSRLAIEHFVSGVWLRCLQQRGVATTAQSEIPDWLQQALIRIEEADVFRHGVPGLVQVAGRSAEHVSRACKKYVQLTPSQIVNQARMQFAAYQLRMTSRSVQAIANDCGFDDPGRFYRLFKKHYGTTPRRYRCE